MTVLVVVVVAGMILVGGLEAGRRAYLGRSMERGMAHAAQIEHSVGRAAEPRPGVVATEVDLAPQAPVRDTSGSDTEPGDRPVPA